MWLFGLSPNTALGETLWDERDYLHWASQKFHVWADNAAALAWNPKTFGGTRSKRCFCFPLQGEEKNQVLLSSTLQPSHPGFIFQTLQGSKSQAWGWQKKISKNSLLHFLFHKTVSCPPSFLCCKHTFMFLAWGSPKGGHWISLIWKDDTALGISKDRSGQRCGFRWVDMTSARILLGGTTQMFISCVLKDTLALNPSYGDLETQGLRKIMKALQEEHLEILKLRNLSFSSLGAHVHTLRMVRNTERMSFS